MTRAASSASGAGAAPRADSPAPLAALLPARGEVVDADEILARFMTWVASTGLALYPAQEEALLEIMAGQHGVLQTPTGSGDLLGTDALHFNALPEGRRSVFARPVHARCSRKILR